MFVREYEGKEPNGLRDRRWEGSVKMGVKVSEYFCLRIRSIGGFCESDDEPLTITETRQFFV